MTQKQTDREREKERTSNSNAQAKDCFTPQDTGHGSKRPVFATECWAENWCGAHQDHTQMES